MPTLRTHSRSSALHVLHVSAEDGVGGAGRAALRLHQSLEGLPEDAGVRSTMLVARRTSDDPCVHMIERSLPTRTVARSVQRLSAQVRRLHRTTNSAPRSTALIPSLAHRRIEKLDPDVVLLHWLGNRALSIRQIGRLLSGDRAVAWVLHDTWPFCGAEHYPDGNDDLRFVEGYLPGNRPSGDAGVDLNRHVWRQKRRRWSRSAQLIAPSNWIAEQARRSALMSDWPVQVIPNPIDVVWWGSSTRAEARRSLGLPMHRQMVLFGADGGASNPRKGADLLRAALPAMTAGLAAAGHGVPDVVMFGGAPGVGTVGGAPTRSVGRLTDVELRRFYTAADVVVVPSRQDNLPQVAVEATVCGTPVVAFDIGGQSDIVEDGVTGRLVAPFSTDRLADSIVWVLEDAGRHARLSMACRMTASRWEPSRIARAVTDLMTRRAREERRCAR